ncbi:MAG: succinate--CoA ligase subunit alpha [Candidatus Nezhaarchaeota archaeon]|nr:succinate--CoA ligase subunit alpha [Candidatus Nezhaarchaeota archaeon]MCX8142511.1 succinate--CoA ligase subunit alpha [Candidatus Nezhaarchaeota archaeon]MDW8050516.1 succinate--CoA ligase subunit alpha [Nitrososphaerota archaeon]
MGILVNKDTRVIVQGITGRLGSAQTKMMLEYGTKIVAGVTPGRGGETIFGIPVYDSVEEALREHEADASVLYVPAPSLKEAAFEAMEAGIKFMVIITDWVPVHDALEIKAFASRLGARYIGPNTPGITVPGEIKLGMIHTVTPGNIAVISRSGTLTGEVTNLLTTSGLGQSVVLGLGGDPVVGLRLKEVLELLERDEHTEAIVIIGEIGGTMEEEAADYIRRHVSKPVAAFIAGITAPPEKRMGHAGAIITGGRGTAESKISALKSAGVKIAKTPWDLPTLLKDMLRR